MSIIRWVIDFFKGGEARTLYRFPPRYELLRKGDTIVNYSFCSIRCEWNFLGMVLSGTVELAPYSGSSILLSEFREKERERVRKYFTDSLGI